MIQDGTAVFQVIDKSEPFPAGWLAWHETLHKRCVKANGATVQRADYPMLVKYATDNNLWTDNSTAYPLKYGVGDGTTTMVLPNWIGRVPQGAESFSGQWIAAGLPNIDGFAYLSISGQVSVSFDATDGVFTTPQTENVPKNSAWAGEDAYLPSHLLSFSAARSNPIYGNSTTVQPPAGGLIPQIYY